MAERDRRRQGPEDAAGFLGRWSRRKAEARRAEQAAEVPDPPPDPNAPATSGGESAPREHAGEVEPVDPRDLPDIDSLHRGSDFKVFMRPGVPPELRTQALRRLWRVDPSFSKLDGLVEYGEDYTVSKRPRDAIRTAYQVGRGFMDRLEEAGAAAPAPPGVPEADQPDPGGAGDAPVGAAPEPAPDAPEVTAGAPSGAEPEREVQAGTARPNDPGTAADPPESRRRRPLPRRG